MAPDDAAHLGMPVADSQELVGVAECNAVEPAAAHRHGLVVEGNQAVARPVSCKALFQKREFTGWQQPAVIVAGKRIEHHE